MGLSARDIAQGEKRDIKYAKLQSHGIISAGNAGWVPLPVVEGRPILDKSEHQTTTWETMEAIDRYKYEDSDDGVDAEPDPLVWARMKQRNAKLAIKKTSKLREGEMVGLKAVLPKKPAAPVEIRKAKRAQPKCSAKPEAHESLEPPKKRARVADRSKTMSRDSDVASDILLDDEETTLKISDSKPTNIEEDVIVDMPSNVPPQSPPIAYSIKQNLDVLLETILRPNVEREPAEPAIPASQPSITVNEAFQQYLHDKIIGVATAQPRNTVAGQVQAQIAAAAREPPNSAQFPTFYPQPSYNSPPLPSYGNAVMPAIPEGRNFVQSILAPMNPPYPPSYNAVSTEFSNYAPVRRANLSTTDVSAGGTVSSNIGTDETTSETAAKGPLPIRRRFTQREERRLSEMYNSGMRGQQLGMAFNAWTTQQGLAAKSDRSIRYHLNKMRQK